MTRGRRRGQCLSGNGVTQTSRLPAPRAVAMSHLQRMPRGRSHLLTSGGRSSNPGHSRGSRAASEPSRTTLTSPSLPALAWTDTSTSSTPLLGRQKVPCMSSSRAPPLRSFPARSQVMSALARQLALMTHFDGKNMYIPMDMFVSRRQSICIALMMLVKHLYQSRKHVSVAGAMKCGYIPIRPATK